MVLRGRMIRKILMKLNRLDVIDSSRTLYTIKHLIFTQKLRRKHQLYSIRSLDKHSGEI
jgi:hypothetical protein